MKHKYLALTLGVFITGLLLIVSCKKINESTTLGTDLIPTVDNINTFDTVLEVKAYNDTFTLVSDTTYYGNTATHFLGQIINDPFFGKTQADLYLELKPSSYKHTFSNLPDSLNIDSVVLILDYVETYGDTSVLQTVNVYEIPQSSDFGDTSYSIRKSNYAKGTLLGSRSFLPLVLNDSVKVYKDTTANQLRIRLDDSFGQRLLNYDTTDANGKENAYATDSAFRTKFKGFALESTAGNGLMGFNLGGENTKLAIYYKDDNGGQPVEKWDTTVAYFTFAGNARSASANFIQRDYTGTALASSVNGNSGLPDELVYIQTTPGSFATIKIPGLASLTNRVVHKAELLMEQVYDPSDALFPPVNLYLDAYDTSVSTFRTIPYDFQFDQTGVANLNSFGATGFYTKDPVDKTIKAWRFDLTRYVQHVANDTETAYDLRLSSPYYIRELYRPGILGSSSILTSITVNNAAGKGRVRLGGGNHPTQKMRLRIVYSKI